MRGSFAISLILHVTLLCALLYQPPTEQERQPGDSGPRVVMLFVPARTENKVSKKSNSSTPTTSAARQKAKSKEAKLDLSAIELAIRDDVNKEILNVLKRYRGWIVLSSSFDGSTVMYQAPSWKRASSKPTAGIGFGLEPLEWWPEAEALARQGPKDADISVLFPASFTDAMGDVIRMKAAALGITEVHRVVFSFSSHEKFGFVVHEIS